MPKKVLLTNLTTVRDGKRVRLSPKSKKAVDLTAEEIDLLDRLTEQTGRPHYRDPVNEIEDDEDFDLGGDGDGDENDGDDENNDEFDGESVAVDEKSVPQLKAYLDHNEVEYPASANKAALLKLAKAHEADGGL